MVKLTVPALAALAACVAGSVALGDAESDYKAIFGKEAAGVSSSTSKADDVAFARKLLESAGSVSESPKLQILLYENAFKFASASSEGLPIALQVLDILAKTFPARKADWQERRLALLRNQYMRARGEAKKAAAATYLDALLLAADALMAAGQPAGAVPHYRSARSVATYYRKEMLAEIRTKLNAAGDAAFTDGKVRALQSRLKIKPTDARAREDLVMLYVIQIDAPAKARDVLRDSVGEDVRVHVRLAAQSADDLSEGDCLRLGDWYYKTLLSRATGLGKRVVLERARGYYERYLATHTAQDVPRFRADSALKKIKTDLASLAPKPRTTTPTSRVPKDTVAFGRHHYKAVLARNVPWHEAAKACRKLGGHLVTIESAGELAFLQELVGRNRLWVGATDQEAEGRWVWINGKPLSREFRLWGRGEPDGGRGSNYASVLADGVRDTPGPTSVGGYICEWDQ